MDKVTFEVAVERARGRVGRELAAMAEESGDDWTFKGMTLTGDGWKMTFKRETPEGVMCSLTVVESVQIEGAAPVANAPLFEEEVH